MKRGQGLIITLLVVIAGLLGVIFFQMVRPSLEGPLPGNMVQAPEADNSADAEPVVPEKKTANPIDEIVDNVIAQDAAPPQPPQVKLASIPKQFWGNWTQHPELCGQEGADDSVLDVAPKAVRFREVAGDVESVVIQNPMTIDITASFTGQGESWQSTTTYALSGSRQELLVSQKDAKGLWYKRCPTAP